MQAFLGAAPSLRPDMFEGALGGKMMGVLVVRAKDGRVGYLRGFAGMLGERRLVPGFVPPAYDVARFEGLWAEGGAAITRLDREIVGLRAAPSLSTADQARLEAAVLAQRELSRSLHARLHETYQLTNALGLGSPIRALFEPRMPPGGSGDCAAPKLLARAYALGAWPLAVAEFWWGGPPLGGGRRHGVYYPACRGRCAKILPFMLEGLECEPAPDVGLLPIGEQAPKVLHEDGSIVVVEKPCGLLSVPGRGPQRRDSVEHRLQRRLALADPTWPRMAHRLDLATSGVLIAAKTKPAYVALQRQFTARTIDKRYVAIVRGRVQGESGVIELALARDLDDRPRQIHDPIDGKASVTHWRVLSRGAETTRLALEPKTGRTHQLRVHLAHPKGLDAPIVGDALYGYGGRRLLLHAESITFLHPDTGEPMQLRSPCPF